MKKQAAFIAMIMLSTLLPVISFASGMCYIGVGTGYKILQVKRNLNISTISGGNEQEPFVPGDLLNHSPFNAHLYENGINADVFAGYGFMLAQKGYLGLEARVNFADITTTADAYYTVPAFNFQQGATINTKIKNSYGFAITPGYFITPRTLVFLDLGLRRAKIEQDYNITNQSPVFVIGRQAFTNHFNTSQWRNGFEYGIGLQTRLNNHWSVRGTVLHTSYQSIKLSGNTGPIDTNNDIARFNSYAKVRTTTFNISLVWKFGEPQEPMIYRKYTKYAKYAVYTK